MRVFLWSPPLGLYIVGFSSMSWVHWYPTWPCHVTFDLDFVTRPPWPYHYKRVSFYSSCYVEFNDTPFDPITWLLTSISRMVLLRVYKTSILKWIEGVVINQTHVIKIGREQILLCKKIHWAIISGSWDIQFQHSEF